MNILPHSTSSKVTKDRPGMWDFFPLIRSGSIGIMLLLLSAGAMSQKTTVRGVVPGGERMAIQLTTPGDLITNVEKTLSETRVDTLGRFSFTLNIDKTIIAYINIDFHRTEIYLEPGKTYNLKFAAMNFDDYSEINPFLQSQNLAYEMERKDSTELNSLISTYNGEYSNFLMNRFKELYNDRNRTLLDTFRAKTERQYRSVNNVYFNTFITYSFASLEHMAQIRNQWQLANRYLTDKPIHYSNTEYMDFFNNFFSKYITVTSNILRKIDYKELLRKPDPEKAILKAMAADTLLPNDQLRELVMLKGMIELYNTPGYDQNQVLTVLKNTRLNSKYADNKIVAENSEKLLTKLKSGYPAPAFTLMNREKKMKSLKDFLGKPVVLNFWTTYCEECLNQMDLIRPMYDKFRDKVNFVSISADRSFAKMLFFINLKKDYVWNFLSAGDQMTVLKAYEVTTYPLFVIIDKNGNLVQYPAALPARGLEEELTKLTEE